MTENELKKMTELDIIRLIKSSNTNEADYNQACEFLMKKYEKMFHHNWHVLCRQMNNSDLVLSLKDEYYSEACEAFLAVLGKVDLNRVYDEKFKLMQLLSFYLRNVRTKLIKETLKKSKLKSLTSMVDTTESDSGNFDPDVELSYWNAEGYMHSPEYVCEQADMEECCKKVIETCMKRWNNTQKTIFTGLRENKTRAEIARSLNIPANKVYAEIKNLKADVKKELAYYVA